MPAAFQPRHLFSDSCSFAFVTEWESTGSKRESEFAAGRHCASLALQQAGYKNLEEITAEVKNAPTRAPIWPEGFTGSITHTRGFTLAVVAPKAPHSKILGLGVDAERILSEETALRIRDKILTKNEVKLLKPHSGLGLSLGQSVGLIFSAKESLYKALNPLTQTFFGFQDAEVIRFAPEEIRLRLQTSLSKDFDRGFEIAARFQIQERIVTVVEVVI